MGAESDGCSTETDPAENKSGSGGKTVSVGQPITLKGTQYTVLGAKTATSVGGAYLKERAPAGTVFVIARLRLVNKKTETHTIASDSIKFIGANGKSYDPDTDASIAADGSLILEEIQPDVPKTGKVIYAVPKAQIVGSKLRVEDFFSDAHGFIKLGLLGAGVK